MNKELSIGYTSFPFSVITDFFTSLPRLKIACYSTNPNNSQLDLLHFFTFAFSQGCKAHSDCGVDRCCVLWMCFDKRGLDESCNLVVSDIEMSLKIFNSATRIEVQHAVAKDSW